MVGETIAFSEVADLVRQTVQPQDAAGMPYIGLEHIEEGTLCLNGYGQAEDVTSTKFRFSQGDILFGELRPYFRKVIRAPFDGVCSTDIWVVRAKPAFEQGYLYYWMASQDFVDFATQGSEGTKMPRAKWEHVCRYKQTRLPLNEQRAIAHILGTLDDKIELNRKMNETLDAIARAIFKSWFIDFDPVRAKAEGRDPGLPKEIADLFPDSFEDSELGKIPKGWRVKSIGDVVETIKGRSYKSSELMPSSTGLVTLKSIARGGGYRPDGLKPFVGDYKPEQVLKAGELVIACTDVTQAAEVIGKPAIVRFDPRFETLVASLDLLIVRPISKYISIPFLYLLFRTDDFQAHIYAHTNGTTVLHLDKKGVSFFKFVCPPDEILQKFSEFSAQLFNKIKNNEIQSRTLASIRDALLPKLISGEIRVKDAERFLKEVAL